MNFQEQERNLESVLEDQLSQIIKSVFHALSSKKDLSPKEDTSALFLYLGRLILSNNPYHKEVVDSLQRDGTLQSLIGLCCKGEIELERYWANRVIRGENSITQFPYYENYLQLTKFELEQMQRHINLDGESLLFVGSGALPLTATMFKQQQPSLEIRCIDKDAEFGKTFLVEPLEERLSSPALIYFISKEGDLHYIGGSEQELSKRLEYSGSRFPLHLKKHNPQDLLAVGNKIAEKIRAIGFIGPFNIDFIETSDGIYPVECNARFCSSLYTAIINEIIKKRHGDYRYSLTLSYTGLTGIRNFGQLQERVDSMLYDGTNIDCRVIPINVGHLNNGRVVVIFTSKSEAELIESYKAFGKYIDIRK